MIYSSILLGCVGSPQNELALAAILIKIGSFALRHISLLNRLVRLSAQLQDVSLDSSGPTRTSIMLQTLSPQAGSCINCTNRRS